MTNEQKALDIEEKVRDECNLYGKDIHLEHVLHAIAFWEYDDIPALVRSRENVFRVVSMYDSEKTFDQNMLDYELVDTLYSLLFRTI